MNTINYQELRELYLASTEKLYFPYTNAAHANPTNIISCYRLCSDQNLDFLIILKSGYDESLFFAETYCSSEDSAKNVLSILQNMQATKSQNITFYVCDYNNLFFDYALRTEQIKVQEMFHYKHYIYAPSSPEFVDIPKNICILKLTETNDVNDREILELVKSLPEFERHIKMSYKSLSKTSDAMFILKYNDSNVAFLANLICQDVSYRDIALIAVSKEFRNHGYATILAHHFAQESCNAGCIPVYTHAANQASQRTAEKAGFIHDHSSKEADITIL